MSEELTAEYVRERLNYDPDTGLFTWRTTWNPKFIGKNAGHMRHAGKANGYVCICLKNREIFAHRLAWFYVYGKWPNGALDHINRVKNDNRIANLREALPWQNAANIDLPAHNRTGFKGVTWRKHAKKWCAEISILGRSFHLGSFDTAEEAAAEYDRFARHIHGEFYYKAEQA